MRCSGRYQSIDGLSGHTFPVYRGTLRTTTSTGEASPPQGPGDIPVSHEGPASCNGRQVEHTPQYVYCIFSLPKRLRPPLYNAFKLTLRYMQRLWRFKRRMLSARTPVIYQQASSSLLLRDNSLKRNAWLNVQTNPPRYVDSGTRM